VPWREPPIALQETEPEPEVGARHSGPDCALVLLSWQVRPPAPWRTLTGPDTHAAGLSRGTGR
jgi:hypothetical protein